MEGCDQNHCRLRRRFSAAERVVLLGEYNCSQLTQREFVAQHDLSLATLIEWLRLERQSAKAPAREKAAFRRVAAAARAGLGALGGGVGAVRRLDRATDPR